MGRVKLQIKKIENNTNRQVTFSKRRNGLIKKAYELSVLCDVDVALLMFSPSGRVSIFSGNKSIEEIVARYMNIPDHERRRYSVHLKRVLGKSGGEADQFYHATSSPINAGSQLEEIQQEIERCKSQMEVMEKRLRIFEGDPSEITTLCEAEYREHILEETLKCVRLRKQALEEKRDYANNLQSTSQVHLPPETANVNEFMTRHPNTVLDMDWLPHSQRDPQVQIMNFLHSNSLLHLREESRGIENMLPSSSSFINGHSMQLDDQTSPSSGMAEDEMQRSQLRHVTDANFPSWTTGYFPTAGNGALPTAQPRERALLEQFLSQLTP
ncbi:hypothetical protein NMG60_11031211 [Bertholletia excelsa]